MTAASFWLADRPLVLASGSAARRALLEAAAVPFVVVPAEIDERAIEGPLQRRGAGPAEIAAHLAEAKARSVGTRHPGDLVLGADQTLALDGRMFTKPPDRAEARRTLEALAGRSHALHSAYALVRDGDVLAAGETAATLTMRSLGSVFLDSYLEQEGDTLLSSVGAYRLEGRGLHLFSKVEGDHATILGLPLLPVLTELRHLGYLLG